MACGVAGEAWVPVDKTSQPDMAQQVPRAQALPAQGRDGISDPAFGL